MSLQRKSSANITTCNSNGKEWSIVKACRGHETDPMEPFFRKWDIRIRMVVYKFAFGFNPLWVLASWLLDVVYEYSGHMHLFLVRLLFMPSPALSIVHASKMQRSTWEISEESNVWHKANAKFYYFFLRMNRMNDGNSLAEAYSHLPELIDSFTSHKTKGQESRATAMRRSRVLHTHIQDWKTPCKM